MSGSWIFGALLLAFVGVGTAVLHAIGTKFSAEAATGLPLLWTVPLAFIGGYALTPLAARVARALGAIDHPGGRKIHEQPTPLLGGLAIYASFAACVLLGVSLKGEILGIFLASTLVFGIGILEDTVGLSALLRLGFQTLAVAILLVSGVSLTFLPSVWWGVLGEWSLTFLWIVGITNAFNFLDGLDGLATGSAAVHAFFLGVYASVTGQFHLAFLSMALMGAALGFLPYNYRPYRAGTADIFLGDSGSTFLGFTLAALAVSGDWAENSPKDLIVPILIMAVPIFDMILITVMRFREGLVRNLVEWIIYTGRDHFHHRLLGLGIRKKEAVAIIYLINACLGISAFLLKGSSTVDAFLVLVQVTIIFSIIGYAMVVMAKRRIGPSETREKSAQEWIDSRRRAI